MAHHADSTTARRMITLVLAGAVALAVAGCGTGSGAAEVPEATAPSEATEPAGEETAGRVETEAPGPADQDAETQQPETQDAGTGNPDAAAEPDEQSSDVEDGSFAAYLTEVDESAVVVDKIEILAGEEAEAARADDGEPPVEDGLDIPYLRNRNDLLRTLPVAADVTVAVYDCSQACEHVEWSYADLVAGEPLPYGGPDAPFMVTVLDGEVVEISEVYLP